MKSSKLLTRVGAGLFYLLLLSLVMLKDVDLLFAVVLLTWLSIVLYALLNVKKHIVLLSFFLTFFTFLLGRETFYYFEGLGKYWVFHTPEVNRHTYLVLIISMLGVFSGYLFKNSFISIRVNRPNALLDNQESYRLQLRKVAKYGYVFTYIFLLLAVFFQIRYVQRVGYVESYQATDSGSGVPWIISKFALFCPFLFYLFLATKPPKKEARLPIRMYLVYGFLTLLTGQRFPVMSVVLLILIYYVIRNREERWIEKKHLLSLLVLGPAAVTGLFLIDNIRLNKNIEYSGFFDTFFDFFRVQGGSINVVKYSYYFQDSITDIRFYAFNSIFNNILNLNPYHGNSLDNAFYGTSLAARMSYLIYGKTAYLSGRGVGSSFIAELFHDFGYVGVAIGGFIYGHILRQISNMSFTNIWKTGLQIAMISPLLLSPRGEFDAFIGVPLRRSNIIVLIAVIVVTNILYKRYKQGVQLKEGARDEN